MSAFSFSPGLRAAGGAQAAAALGNRSPTPRHPQATAQLASPHMFTRALGSLLRFFLGFCTALSSANAADSEFSPQVWLNPGVYSRHFDRGQHFREDNVGLGAEVLLAPDHALMVGTYINSERARTHSERARTRYGAYQWRPLHWQPGDINVSAGIVVGAFDGYPRFRNGAWFIAAMPVLVIEGERAGANFSIIPSIRDRIDGAMAVQIKLRVW